MPWGGFPLAGVLAALLFVAVDSWAFGSEGLWRWLGNRIQDHHSLESGVVQDRLAFERLGHSDGQRLRACVIGTSRARRGLLPAFVAPAVERRIELFHLSHAGLQPFEVTALIDELIDGGMDIVVLSMSEFDTHRPLRLSPLTATGSLRALWDLARVTGMAFVTREFEVMLRLSISALLPCYRFRAVERAAGLGELLAFTRPGAELPGSLDLLRFDLGADGEEGHPQQRGQRGLTLYGVPFRLFNLLVQSLAEPFPEVSLPARQAQLRQILSISEGVHAEVQSELLRRAVARLTEAGIDVLIFELPLYPPTAAFYDASTREGFRSFARRLARDERVHFVSLSKSGPITADQFQDLTHVSNAGAQHLSDELARALLAIAKRRAAR